MIIFQDNNCIRLSCSDASNRRKNLVEALTNVCFPINRAKVGLISSFIGMIPWQL